MEAIEEDPVGIRGMKSDGDEVEIAKPSLKPTRSGDVTVPAYRAHLAQASEQQTTVC